MVETKAELISKAWNMRMLNQAWDAGLLVAIDGRVYFLTESGPLFEADKQDVIAKWPWYYFGGGVHLTVGGKGYRIYFTAPQGADFDTFGFLKTLPLDALPQQLVPFLAGLDVLAVGLRAGRVIAEGVKSTKAWREYLGG
jgi:hypothetical protein